MVAVCTYHHCSWDWSNQNNNCGLVNLQNFWRLILIFSLGFHKSDTSSLTIHTYRIIRVYMVDRNLSIYNTSEMVAKF